MWARTHLREVDGLPILAYRPRLAVSLVVSEAVLDAYDDPVMGVVVSECLRQESALLLRKPYHRFVKTTPKPSATKNSKGELVGDEPLVWLLLVAVADGVLVEVDVGMAKKAAAQPQNSQCWGIDI
jgi:hypothetical protein